MSKYLADIIIKKILAENMAAGLGTMASPAKTIIEPFSNNIGNSIDDTKYDPKKKFKNIISKIKNKANGNIKGEF